MPCELSFNAVPRYPESSDSSKSCSENGEPDFPMEMGHNSTLGSSSFSEMSKY